MTYKCQLNISDPTLRFLKKQLRLVMFLICCGYITVILIGEASFAVENKTSQSRKAVFLSQEGLVEKSTTEGAIASTVSSVVRSEQGSDAGLP